MNFSFPRVKKEGMIKLTAWKGILEVVVVVVVVQNSVALEIIRT